MPMPTTAMAMPNIAKAPIGVSARVHIVRSMAMSPRRSFTHRYLSN